MKILFASYNFGNKVVGGAQQSIKVVADELVSRGHEVGVTYVNDPARRWVDDSGILRLELPPNNIYWHPEGRPNPVLRLGWHAIDRCGGLASKAISDQIVYFKPDVVHTNVLCGLTVDIWRVAKNLNIPVVHTIHDYYLLCINSGMRNASGNCSRPCKSCRVASLRSRRFANKYVDGVAYVSDHMRLKHEQESVFSNKVVTRKIVGAFKATPVPISLSTKKSRDGVVFGFLGRVAPDKGVSLLIKAFVDAAIPGATLLIGGVGDESFVSSLKALSGNADVRFLGRVKPDEFFSSIDVLVVPSTWNEPAARVVYEAGVSNVPVVVSRRGGLPELVRNGERGWTFDPDSQGNLLNLLKHISKNPVEVRAKALTWAGAEQEFSPQTIADQTLELYSSIMSNVS